MVNTVYYAYGGGLGHLTRALGILYTLGIDATIVTRGSLPPHEKLIVDTFPAGLFGELAGSRIDYVARYLLWDAYCASVASCDVEIDRAYILESLDPAHEQFIRSRARHVVDDFTFVDPPVCTATGDCSLSEYVLVIHAGPAEEIEELIAFARDVCREERVDAPIVLCAPVAMHRDDVISVDVYPAAQIAFRATRIFTAGGFNCMRQLGGDPRHRPLPFPRKFDDQFRRVALTRRASSAAVA